MLAPIWRAFQRVRRRPLVTVEDGGNHIGIFANQIRRSNSLIAVE
jgi:hypothetical protein